MFMLLWEVNTHTHTAYLGSWSPIFLASFHGKEKGHILFANDQKKKQVPFTT